VSDCSWNAIDLSKLCFNFYLHQNNSFFFSWNIFKRILSFPSQKIGRDSYLSCLNFFTFYSKSFFRESKALYGPNFYTLLIKLFWHDEEKFSQWFWPVKKHNFKKDFCQVNWEEQSFFWKYKITFWSKYSQVKKFLF